MMFSSRIEEGIFDLNDFSIVSLNPRLAFFGRYCFFRPTCGTTLEDRLQEWNIAVGLGYMRGGRVADLFRGLNSGVWDYFFAHFVMACGQGVLEVPPTLT